MDHSEIHFLVSKTKRRKVVRSGWLMIGAATAIALVTSYTPIGKGQLEVRTWTETKDVKYWQNIDAGRRKVTPYICVTTFLTSGTSYTRPADWNASNNTIDCIGGGANGTVSSGGGGGAWAQSVNLAIGATATYGVGGAGGDTFFNATSAANAATNGNTVSCAAKGAVTTTGGLTATSTGVSKFAGGNQASTNGGGAAGPNAAGNNGTGGAGGQGDGTHGGTGGALSTGCSPGGNGNKGTEYDTNHGSGGGGGGNNSNGNGGNGGLYGGGAGGSPGICFSAGTGAAGLIVIVYTPASATTTYLFRALGPV